MLRVEAVAECMGDHVIRHDTVMPGFGKTAQPLVATRCFEDSLHEPMIAILACRCNTAAASERCETQVYFPMQKVAKIRFKISSGVVWPVSESKAQRAR